VSDTAFAKLLWLLVSWPNKIGNSYSNDTRCPSVRPSVCVSHTNLQAERDSYHSEFAIGFATDSTILYNFGCFQASYRSVPLRASDIMLILIHFGLSFKCLRDRNYPVSGNFVT